MEMKWNKMETLATPNIYVNVKKNISTSTIDKIYDIIDSSRGDRPIFLQILDGKHKFIYKYKIEASPKVEDAIRQLIELEQ